MLKKKGTISSVRQIAMPPSPSIHFFPNMNHNLNGHELEELEEEAGGGGGGGGGSIGKALG